MVELFGREFSRSHARQLFASCPFTPLLISKKKELGLGLSLVSDGLGLNLSMLRRTGPSPILLCF